MGISSFLLQNPSHFCFFLFYMPVNWLMQNLEQQGSPCPTEYQVNTKIDF